MKLQASKYTLRVILGLYWDNGNKMETTILYVMGYIRVTLKLESSNTTSPLPQELGEGKAIVESLGYTV